MFKKLSIVLLLICVMGFTACKQNVTETGNPYDPPQAVGGGDDGGGVDGVSDPDSQGGNSSYYNQNYNIIITYPENWSYDANSVSENTVIFSDDESPVSAAIFRFSTYIGRVDLLTYLGNEYPSKFFLEYNTNSLNGYMYDDPNTGENGGDLKEYYFLSSDILIVVSAEIFTADNESFEALLGGMSVE